jgi:4-hydroxybenzoate polyprenyltransferase
MLPPYQLYIIRSILRKEISLFLGFSWRDWSATIIPSGIFALGGLKDLTCYTAIWRYLLVVIWVTLYIYSFNLFTQSLSVEEDRINKPDRPIPSGQVSVDAALKRCGIVWALFFAISAFNTHIICEEIVWVILTVFLGATKAGGHWIGKNVIGMSVGSWALLSPSRKLLGPLNTQSSRHILAMSAWAALITNAQDFRDHEGDVRVGRKTIPICFGDRTARYILALILAPLTFFSDYYIGPAQNAPWVIGGMYATVIYRFLTFRNRESDHQSYMVSIGPLRLKSP